MTNKTSTNGWFAGLSSTDRGAILEAINEGSADSPDKWPVLATEAGFVETENEYYSLLHEYALDATNQAIQQAERQPDQQLIHAVRALDDTSRVVNELAERITEWAGSQFNSADTGVEYVRELASQEVQTDDSDPLFSLAVRVRELDDERRHLQTHVEESTPQVAPNLSELAGPILAARLIALAGGLESLAKKPAGTIQVLGAEDALFAHLRGQAPSPKHGIIFTHNAIQQTHPAHRGSAARALAGKLAIAARIDYYSGVRNPDIKTELEDRITQIQNRETT